MPYPPVWRRSSIVKVSIPAGVMLISNFHQLPVENSLFLPKSFLKDLVVGLPEGAAAIWAPENSRSPNALRFRRGPLEILLSNSRIIPFAIYLSIGATPVKRSG